MRIKKVTASTEEVNQNLDENKYAAAIKHIDNAISELSAYAKQDELAKESIANLSVVLLDLKSTDN